MSSSRLVVQTFRHRLSTKGFTHIVDLTGEVRVDVERAGVHTGHVLVFVQGSTASITTIEYEPGLVEEDLPALLERLIPYRQDYAHHRQWNDDNGASHLRASWFGPSVVVPVVEGELALGTWQQIVLVDFDTRPRTRTVFVQVWGIRQ